MVVFICITYTRNVSVTGRTHSQEELSELVQYVLKNKEKQQTVHFQLLQQTVQGVLLPPQASAGSVSDPKIHWGKERGRL